MMYDSQTYWLSGIHEGIDEVACLLDMVMISEP